MHGELVHPETPREIGAGMNLLGGNHMNAPPIFCTWSGWKPSKQLDYKYLSTKKNNQVATIFLYFRFRFKSFQTNPGVPFFSNLQRFGYCFERHLVHRDLQNGASPVEDFSAQ